MGIQADVWYGDLNDEWAEDAVANSLAAQVAAIQGLKPFPQTAARLLRLMHDDGFDIAEIGRLIESDVSLASRVLMAANSALFGLRVRCSSVNHAVVLLGARTVSEIAMGLTVMGMFEGGGIIERLRQHSITTAGFARFWALRVGVPADDVFTCGLLHDIGQLLLLQADTSLRKDPSSSPYGRQLVASLGQESGLYRRERQLLGYDHAMLGAHVLREWNIPDPVPSVVAYHHELEAVLHRQDRMASIVAAVMLADQIADAMGFSPETLEELPQTLAAGPAASLLGLGAEDLQGAWHQLEEGRAEALSLAG